ncbi:hypothetical protein NKR23_g10184 [Pleurostoma richardsiae]|uniref:Uncharacterized protein n=1 Tax=Pleurostoma richardsiae TaxID=41990 RepID=A0AA38RDE4_9PEZI|nr:hypothetical protein NKR23_g10184 [Pleurostoma richardsiae]
MAQSPAHKDGNFVVTDSHLAALVCDAAKQKSASTALLSKIEKMPSITDLIPGANILARGSLVLKPS